MICQNFNFLFYTVNLVCIVDLLVKIFTTQSLKILPSKFVICVCVLSCCVVCTYVCVYVCCVCICVCVCVLCVFVCVCSVCVCVCVLLCCVVCVCVYVCGCTKYLKPWTPCNNLSIIKAFRMFICIYIQYVHVPYNIHSIKI